MERSQTKNLFPVIYSLPFLVAAGLSILMLATDRNLQTDFGTVSSGYFSHWYAVLAVAVADIVAALLLLTFRSRAAVKLAVVGSGLLTVALVGAVLTYQQAGFASAMDFANYLFGVTYYGGDIRYLYDVLLATQVATFVGGGVGLALTRAAGAPASSSETGAPSSG
jgi:asparagine N-glycosylation enzyme membrane subunit Stt3